MFSKAGNCSSVNDNFNCCDRVISLTFFVYVFVNTAMVTGAFFCSGPRLYSKTQSANDRLNIAAIGVGGRGAADVGGVAGGHLG